MSYYILPRKNIDFEIQIKTTPEYAPILTPYISQSIFFFLGCIKNQIEELIPPNECLSLHTFMNPYEFIFSKVPPTYSLSVSKLKQSSNTFYIFMEIIQMFSLLDFFEERNIKTVHYGLNSPSVIECFELLREDNDDVHLQYNTIVNMDCCYTTNEYMSDVDFLSYELSNQEYLNQSLYITKLMAILCNIITHQSANGVTIIKIHNIFYKPIIEILYMLSSMYEKIVIVKPNMSAIHCDERYIVCKNFMLDNVRIKNHFQYFLKFNTYLTNHSNEKMKYNPICSLLKNKLPCLFVNKIEESNIIIVHQQLEYLTQLLAMYKNPNRDSKLEMIRKSNIQKCVHWCEKFKIPHNKFNDKINIFLSRASAPAPAPAPAPAIMGQSRFAKNITPIHITTDSIIDELNICNSYIDISFIDSVID